jgi:type I site-specific restriction endonuclease
MISESEWLTRKRCIDGRLKALGWKLVKFSQRLVLDSLDKFAVEELPTANGPADYGLFVAGRLREVKSDEPEYQIFRACILICRALSTLY